jgi:hypothetical protein
MAYNFLLDVKKNKSAYPLLPTSRLQESRQFLLNSLLGSILVGLMRFIQLVLRRAMVTNRAADRRAKTSVMARDVTGHSANGRSR